LSKLASFYGVRRGSKSARSELFLQGEADFVVAVMAVAEGIEPKTPKSAGLFVALEGEAGLHEQGAARFDTNLRECAGRQHQEQQQWYRFLYRHRIDSSVESAAR